MALPFERFIALRYLRSRRKEVFISIITVISILGVAVSVMVLDIVMAVMTGFETALQEKLISANAHIVLRSYAGGIQESDELLDKVRAVDGVVDAFPYTYNQAMVSNDAGSKGLLIRGVANYPGAKAKLAEMLPDTETIDRLFAPANLEIIRPDQTTDTVELPPLIIGKALRDSLGVFPHQPITLIAPHFTASPQGLVPKLRRFVVVGNYSSGLIEYENGLAYTSIKDAQAFFGTKDRVSGIEVVVRDLFQASEIAKRIVSQTASPDRLLYATDWTEQNKPLWDAMRLEKRVYFIVLLLLILVASFSIVSTLVMMVMEKSRDIAILKSIGASERNILSIFLLQGAIVGALGIISGTALGFLGCIGLREFGFEIDEKVFSLSTVPVEIVPANLLLVAVAAFIITTAAGIYPAVRASRLRPAEALRFE